MTCSCIYVYTGYYRYFTENLIMAIGRKQSHINIYENWGKGGFLKKHVLKQVLHFGYFSNRI